MGASDAIAEGNSGMLAESLRGWRLWLSGGLAWRAVVITALLLHLSFLPRPWGRESAGAPPRPSVWAETAWDTHWFAKAPGADFFAIYEAGYRARAGRDPYSVHVDKQSDRTPYFASFRYIPLTAWLLGAPLSLAPLWTAYAGWLAFNELLLFLNLGLTAAMAPADRRRALGLLWLVWFPLHIEWHMGQFSFLMGTLLFWTGWSLWRGSAGAAGMASEDARAPIQKSPIPNQKESPIPNPQSAIFCWGLSVWLKNWTVLLWPWWWRWGGRRAGWAATAWLAAAAATTVGYFAFHPDAWATYRAAAADGKLIGGVGDVYWGRQGVQMAAVAVAAGGRIPDGPDQTASAAGWWDGARLANGLLWIGSLGVVLAAVFLAGGERTKRTERTKAEERGERGEDNLGRHAHASGAAALDVLALVWLWWFFGYLDTWEHHYVMLLPLTALLGATGRLSGAGLWVPAALWGAPSLFAMAAPAVAQGDQAARLLVILYFLQRPVGVVWAFAALSRGVFETRAS